MSMSTVNARVETATKDEANEIFENLGLNMTTAVNMFLKQVVNRRAIPFEIAEQPSYNAKTLASIEEARLIAEGKIPAKGYTNPEELWSSLDADD